VEHILQDHFGFYWITTQNGLNRFDGTNFKIYLHHPGDSTSLSDNFCKDIIEDKTGDLWVATNFGLSHYIRSRDYFHNIYFQRDGQTPDITNQVFRIVYDGDHHLWIAGAGLWRYDIENGELTFFPGQSGNPHYPPIIF
jgi:ligand-binding sensor domain-containing protein